MIRFNVSHVPPFDRFVQYNRYFNGGRWTEFSPNFRWDDRIFEKRLGRAVQLNRDLGPFGKWRVRGVKRANRAGGCFEGIAFRRFCVGDPIQQTAKKPIECWNAMPQPNGHGFGLGAKSGLGFQGRASKRESFAAPRDCIANSGVKQSQIQRQARGGSGTVEADIIGDRCIAIVKGGHESQEMISFPDNRATKPFFGRAR